LDTAKGGGSKSLEWRVYLLERYVEVMVKILLTYRIAQGEELSFETMLRYWDEEAINMQANAATSLQSFLEGDIDLAEAA
jgi:hypothetical protein